MTFGKVRRFARHRHATPPWRSQDFPGSMIAASLQQRLEVAETCWEEDACGAAAGGADVAPQGRGQDLI